MADDFTKEKDPEARLDYQIDWGTHYLEDGDTIVASTWTAPNTEGAVEIAEDTHTASTATVWLEGGTAGQKYRVTNHIVTSGTREDDRTLIIKCKEL